MASPSAKGLFHRAIVQSGGLNILTIAAAENYMDDDVEGNLLSSKEIVNNLLVNDGSAADRNAAKSLQEDMRAEDAVSYPDGKSPEAILDACRFKGSKGAKKELPAIFGDGYVLPKDMTNAELFSDRANYNAVPVILGSNRDESKLFMMMGDEFIDKKFGIPVGFKDETGYERMNCYSSDLWKIDGVDSLTALMREAQGETVFANRFDVDDLRSLGVIDLKKLMGAAHAMEISFVFGNFPNSMKMYYPKSVAPANLRLADSMMSYWAQFAYSGDPGRGRSGSEVAWTAWQNGDKNRLRLMVFDTAIDQGIRMSSDRITMADLKARFLADTRFADQEKY